MFVAFFLVFLFHKLFSWVVVVVFVVVNACLTRLRIRTGKEDSGFFWELFRGFVFIIMGTGSKKYFFRVSLLD